LILPRAFILLDRASRGKENEANWFENEFEPRTGICPAYNFLKYFSYFRTFAPQHATMGLFDAFRGSKKGDPSTQGTSSTQGDGDARNSSEQLSSDAFRSGDLDFSGSQISSASFSSGNAGDLEPRYYNPYEGISAALDRRDVKQPFRLPAEPEFLFSEESIVQRRSWSENLTYYTGVGYMTGAFAGGGIGMYRVLGPGSLGDAANAAKATQSNLSQRMRVNQVLNSSGKLGRSAGNALGVLGLLFSSSESFYLYLNDRILPEDLMTVAAGATTGVIFRSVRGPRQALAAGAVGSIFASMLLGLRLALPGL
jgi:import inner membrane translocase subunit TIM23